MTNRFGHFGLPAVLIASMGLAALLLHLTVPYAVVHPADAGADDETMDRGEAADFHDGNGLVGASAPGVTLAGTIVLLAAGLGLLVAGFLPMGVAAARGVGWGGGLAAVVGALMAFTSSMHWVGAGLGQYPYGATDLGGFQGFGFSFDFGTFAVGGLTGGLSGLMELWMKTDNAGTVWVISPALVAAAAMAALVAALRLCGNVVRLDDGMRERARGHLRAALWAGILLGLVLLLPWAMGTLPDYEGAGDEDMFVFGAHTILNVDDASDGEVFGTVAVGITLVTAAGWIGVLAGTLGSLGGVLASVGAPAPLARGFHHAVFVAAAAALLAVAGFFTAFGASWRPYDGADGFQPAWLNLLVLAALAVWVLAQVRILRSVARRAGRPGAATAPVSFE